MLRQVALQREAVAAVAAAVRPAAAAGAGRGAARRPTPPRLVLAQLVGLSELAAAAGRALEAARPVLVADVLHQVVLDGERLVADGADVADSLRLLPVLQALVGHRQVVLLSTGARREGHGVRDTAVTGTAVRGTAARSTATRGTQVRGREVRGTEIRGRGHGYSNQGQRYEGQGHVTRT